MIIFMGVAGAGKSVQGRLLADSLGYKWLSTGEFLRMHISGERRKEMLQGKLLDDQEIIKIIDKYLVDTNDDEMCILDGFPRTLAQAKWLLSQHKSKDVSIDGVVHLIASQQIVLDRLLARGRQDDTKEAIAHRFKEYEEQTLPIVDWFRSEKIPVFEIDSERTIDQIHSDILQRFQKIS